MKDKNKKAETVFMIEDEPSSAPRVSTSGREVTSSHKRLRKINPIGMRVVVSIQKQNDTTDAGLYLPEGTKQSMSEAVLAEVVEVASAVDDDTNEEANVSGIPLGALVLIGKDVGIKIPWDENLRIIETKQVLATVNEIEIT